MAAPLKPITEISRRASPAPKPQALVWDLAGKTLWISSRQTRRVYALDPATLAIKWETEAPGTPQGMTVVGQELRVICGETEEDHRFIRRCVPGEGFDPRFAIPCPDDTGSHLSWDGVRLTVSQWYPKKLIQLDAQGRPGRVIHVQREICGQVMVGGAYFLITTDDEETDRYFLVRIDLGRREGEEKATDLAQVPFAARALGFDGTHFWTNHRDQNQIVSFRI